MSGDLIISDGTTVYTEGAVGELITEIKRLRTQVENCHAAKNLHTRRSEKLQEQLATKDAANNDLMANCNQHRDRCRKAESELARWQKIAVDERARVLYFAHAGDDMYDTGCLEESDHFKTRHLPEAARELRLESAEDEPDADNLTIAYMMGSKKADERLKVLLKYVFRLERAYIADSMQSEELARAALGRIREGK
jgi:hypothetical protein